MAFFSLCIFTKEILGIPVNRVPTAFNTLDTELPPSTAVRAPNPFIAQQKKRAGKQVERG